MNKEKFFEAVNKRRGKTTLSNAKKIELGTIDEISDILEEMDWDNRLDSVYTVYREANDFAEGVLANAQNQIVAADIRMDTAMNTLRDLGLGEVQEVIDLQNEANRIRRQVQGLSDDISSGVLV
tara:strand:- start:573 stop:944 length:372 start_codon:yes stop_codon:yes gene_type:complete